MGGGFTFVPPPEAPVFRPTEEEFRDPLEYLMKIRHIGTKTGICKIIPPKSWNPPFAVNMKEFSFTPRIQRLYELEAHSRIKLNFISRLYKFIRTQGGDKIRVPSIGGRFLDLHALHKEVKSAGGYENICKEHQWASVAEKLGYQTRHAHSLRTNYEKLLLAFDNLMYSEQTNDKRPIERKAGSKRLRLLSSSLEDVGTSAKRELRNLQFFGPGPKAAVPVVDTGPSEDVNKMDKNIDDYLCRVCDRGDDEDNLLVCDTDSCQACYHIYCLKPPLRFVPKCQWKCPQCIRSLCLEPPEPYGFPQSTKSYSLHEFGVMADEFKSKYFNRPCTEIPCSVVEHEFWRILQEYNDDVVVEYGADIHSSSQGSGFPTESRLQNLVGTAQQLEAARMYAISPWNLNILPLLDRSVLRFIKGNIDGMKIPWCYVGMVFSSFCWHIEDHWSYSINFNHWGEPKTWYGVSRLHAEDFERAMRKHAPELFDQSPDLLHHITTNMNPNILQSEGVPIYRTDQYCGEFVVTFPRAYHSGFNQGFNFAEAVNICLPDWLAIGRECIEHYAEMKRHCVFSNDELLCTLAEVAVGRCRPEDVLLLTNPYTPPKQKSYMTRRVSQESKPKLPPGCSTAGLDISAIAAVHQEFTILLENERRRRKAVFAAGVHRDEKVRFDQLPDDTRVCDACLTTLFLSGVSCLCTAELSSNNKDVSSNLKRKLSDNNASASAADCDNSSDEVRPKSYMTCPKHVDELCSSCAKSSYTLKYHYTLEELEELERALASRLKDFYSWRERLALLLKDANANNGNTEPNSSSSSSLVILKKEAPDCPSDSPQVCNGSGTTISVANLLDVLREGRESGYHTDDIFSEAESLVERANHLLEICTSLIPWLSSQPDHVPPNNCGNHLVRFHYRLPATFNISTGSNASTSASDGTKTTANVSFVKLQHEMDLNNPRELDLMRLFESCKQMESLNLLQESCVQSLQNFLDRVTGWRQSARETASDLCRLILSTPTRNLAMTSAEVNRMEIDVPEGKIDQEEHAFVLISKTVNDLGADFPHFASRIPEWNTLSLLRQALKWLCVFKRRQGIGHATRSWTVPRLRHHASRGEALLAQLTVVSNPSTTKILSKSATTVSSQGQSPRVSNAVSCATTHSSSVDNAIVPVTRLLRARMHTALGQLSQLVVQVDSLVGLLIESLVSSSALSCAEITAVLGQLRDLNVKHLVQWDVPEEPVMQLHSQINGDNSDRDSVLSDFEPEQSIVDVSTPLAMSDNAQQLLHLLARQVESFLTISELHVPIQDRPQLTEVETLLELGRMLHSSLPMDRNTVDVSMLEETDLFGQNVAKLDALVLNTRNACDTLSEAFNIHTTSDIGNVLKILLPKSANETESEQAIHKYTEAYSKGSTIAMAAYEDLLESRRKSVVNLLEVTLNQNAICCHCAVFLGLKTEGSALSSSGCEMCSLLTQSPVVIPDGTSSRMWNLWKCNSSDGYGLLCTPEAIALQMRCSALSRWLDDLVALLQSHAQLVSEKCAKLEQERIASLPEPLRLIIKPDTSVDCASGLLSIDEEVRAFARELQATATVGSLFHSELKTCLSFLASLVSLLLFNSA